MRKITEAIIHCTATTPDFMPGKTTYERVNEVRRWHTQERRPPWKDIGYHFLIDRDGTIQSGRSIMKNGAHVKGHNTGTIGIALFGGYNSNENDSFYDHFTKEQETSLRKLLAELKQTYGFTKVTGHNDYAAKACPGFRVSKWRHATTASPEPKPKPEPKLKLPWWKRIFGMDGTKSEKSSRRRRGR